MATKWPAHVTIMLVLAVGALGSGIYGNYLSREALRIAQAQLPTETNNQQNTTSSNSKLPESNITIGLTLSAISPIISAALLVVALILYYRLGHTNNRTDLNRDDKAKMIPAQALPTPLTRRPHLSSSTLGAFPIDSNTTGTGIAIVNDETKFFSTAHNLRASINFRHSLGEEFSVNPGFWYTNNSRDLTDRVSIEMQELRWLMLVVTNTIVSDYHAVNHAPPDLSRAPQLEYGEWLVKIDIIGDNVNYSFSGTLSLQKPNGVGWRLLS